MRIKTMQTSNKNLILDVGMEKEQKQELGWRVSVLPIPAFHHCTVIFYVASIGYSMAVSAAIL